MLLTLLHFYSIYSISKANAFTNKCKQKISGMDAAENSRRKKL